MIIKVVGVYQAPLQNYNQPKNVTKFYEPQESKEKVKQDFGVVLDKALEKLHFEKII